LLLLPVLALWGIPIVALPFAAFLSDREEARSTSARDSSWVAVGQRTNDPRIPVSIEITRGASRAIYSSVDGVVTKLLLNESGKIRDGALLGYVNRTSIMVYSGRTPLYRPLHSNMRGSDVRTLNAFLHRTGLLGRSADWDVFDFETQAAVRKLQKRIGVTVDGVLKPDSLTYIPTRSIHVESLVQVGDRVSASVPIAQIEGPVMGVEMKVDEASGAAIPDNAPLLLTIGNREIHLEGPQIPLSDFDAIADGLGDAKPTGPGQDPNLSTVAGSVRLAAPSTFGTVPGKAVLTDTGGHSCVLVKSSDRAGRASVSAVGRDLPPSGELGVAYVPASLIGKRVLSDAAAWPKGIDRRCG
jgi:hypothetical protein